MKKIKNIVLIISLVLNVFMFVYAVTQNLEAQRNLQEAARLEGVAAQARAEAKEQRLIAEENAERMHNALIKAEEFRQQAEEQPSKK